MFVKDLVFDFFSLEPGINSKIFDANWTMKLEVFHHEEKIKQEQNQLCSSNRSEGTRESSEEMFTHGSRRAQA